MKLLPRAAFLLPALLIGVIILGAQSNYDRNDPRWTDDDRTNDPNTCFEEDRDCEIHEDWVKGWCEARVRAGFPPCASESSDSQAASDSQRSRDRGSSSSSRSGGGSPSSSSSNSVSSSSSASVTRTRQTQASAPQPAIRTGSYRLGYDCPYGKICVGHWPSGDIEVYDLDNCCWDTRQAIDTFNVYD